MVRRRLTPEQEQALAEAAEQRTAGDERWDFAAARPVNRGANPTVVLSGRVPAVYAQMLRRRAIAQRCSISDLVKQALEDYAVATLQVSYSRRPMQSMELRTSSAPGAETTNVNGSIGSESITTTSAA
jgi:hypothetical protein